jgi:Flp pilus assembly protein TadD
MLIGMVFRALLVFAFWSLPAVSENPTHPLQHAVALFNAGKYRECLELASAYLKQNPASAAAHKIVGMDQYMLGKPGDAIAELKQAVALAPHDPEAFYYLGRLYFTTDNAPGALAAFQTSLDLDPTSVRTQNQLGQTYEALGRREEAEKAYRKAITLEQNQPKKSEWPYYNLGVLYLGSGRQAEAVPYLRAALERQPAWAQGKVKLATALAGQGQSGEALRLLREAVAAESHNAEAHYRLALLLAKQGNRDEAQQHFALFAKYRAQ